MKRKMARPQTLFEVSESVHSGRAFDPLLREFLDHVYFHPETLQDAVSKCPASINTLEDAYLAATAEHLCLSNHVQPPLWTEKHGPGLSTPYFAGGLETLKALLLVESPLAFRRRNIFISRDALFRPRQAA